MATKIHVQKVFLGAYDVDYLNKLEGKEREWMLKFIKEYYDQTIDRTSDPLHNSERLRKDTYEMARRARRDITYRPPNVEKKKRNSRYSANDYILTDEDEENT